MTRSSCAFAFALALTVSSATPSLSRAAPITWRFEATIREVQATASTTTGVIAPIDAIVSSLGATQGASVSGFVTFDSETPDLLSEATNSRFALLDASVSFSSWTLTMTPPSVSLSFLDVVSYPDLGADLGGSAVVAVADTVDSSATFDRGFFWLQFTSTDPGRFSPGTLPLDPPDLASVDPFGFPNPLYGSGTELFIDEAGAIGYVSVTAELTSVVRVPEVTLLAQLALAGGALLARTRRRF